MKEYIILFNNMLPEIVSATTMTEALYYVAIDTLELVIKKEKRNTNNITKFISEINRQVSNEDSKICAIYELGNHVLCDIDDI